MSNPKQENEFPSEQPVEKETEKVPVQDKRRFSDDGERVEVKVNGQTIGGESPAEETGGSGPEAQAPKQEKKPAEVVALENQLSEITTRCEAAEAKLLEVQKRFETERSNLEEETAEMRVRLKRSLEQQADQSRFDFLKSLLPVLDNLNLALTAATEKDATLENMVDGVQGTARSFEQALVSVGVEAVPAVGEIFNPQFHEAVDMIETDEDQEGLITAEFSKGYTFNGRLLRPARVQVGKSVTRAGGN